MQEDVTIERLEDQIGWYDRKAQHSQKYYKWLKGTSMASAALVPFLIAANIGPWIPGSLGVLVVILESIQQLQQYHSNWIGYRSTCEALKHEKYLYLAKAGPYAVSKDPHGLLAERVEELVSTEHAKWVRQVEASKEAK